MRPMLLCSSSPHPTQLCPQACRTWAEASRAAPRTWAAMPTAALLLRPRPMRALRSRRSIRACWVHARACF